MHLAPDTMCNGIDVQAGLLAALQVPRQTQARDLSHRLLGLVPVNMTNFIMFKKIKMTSTTQLT